MAFNKRRRVSGIARNEFVSFDYTKHLALLGAAVSSVTHLASVVGLPLAATPWSCYVEWVNGALSGPGTFQTPLCVQNSSGTDYVQVYLAPTTGNITLKIVTGGSIMYDAVPLAAAAVASGITKLALTVAADHVYISVNGLSPVRVAAAINANLLDRAVLGTVGSGPTGAAITGSQRKFRSWAFEVYGYNLATLTA